MNVGKARGVGARGEQCAAPGASWCQEPPRNSWGPGSPLGLGAMRNWVGGGPTVCARSRFVQGGIGEIRSRINLF